MPLMTHQDFQVQAIGQFAQATCAPEFGLPRPFNQRLLVLHVGGGAVKQWVKFKTNKFQKIRKRKKDTLKDLSERLKMFVNLFEFFLILSTKTITKYKFRK